MLTRLFTKGETVVAQTISFAKNDKGDQDYKPELFRLTRTDNDYEYLEYVRRLHAITIMIFTDQICLTQTTFEPLFKLLDIQTILYIFECMLMERRIVVVAQSLGTLSACVDAISNMAYPFAWQVRRTSKAPQAFPRLTFIAVCIYSYFAKINVIVSGCTNAVLDGHFSLGVARH